MGEKYQVSLAPEHERIVIDINQQVTRILSNMQDYLEVLFYLSDRKDDIKRLLDEASEEEMDQYCARYDGFYLFMTLLEDMALEIAEGRLPVPRLH